MLLTNAIVFGALAFIWTGKEPLNLLIKLGLIVLWLANAFYWLEQAGYIVKLGA